MQNTGKPVTVTKKLFQVSKGVALPINAQHNPFIPSALDFEDHTDLLEQVAVGVNSKLPILFIGDTGTGKTSLVRFLASKTNNGFRRVNHNGATTVDDIVGKILINKEGTYWIDGVLIEAMRHGYWYLADEINAAPSEINFAYHSLLDDDGMIVLQENNGEIVKPHPNFRFFAAMNPTAEYAGTKDLNKALLSRFIVLKTDFSPPAVEAKILVERAGIEMDAAKRMVKFASDVRESTAKGDFSFVLSTRDLIMWAKMFAVYQKYMVSAEMTVLNKVNADDLNGIKDFLGINFKSLDNPKAKGGKSEVYGDDRNVVAEF